MPLDVIISQSSPTLPPPGMTKAPAVRICGGLLVGASDQDGVPHEGFSHPPPWPSGVTISSGTCHGHVFHRFHQKRVGITRECEDPAVTARLTAEGCSRRGRESAAGGRLRLDRVGRPVWVRGVALHSTAGRRGCGARVRWVHEWSSHTGCAFVTRC